MGITLYEPAPLLADERARETAIEALGPLALQGDAALRVQVTDLRRMLRTAMAAVTVVYRDWQYVVAGAGLPEGPYSRRTSFCGHAVEQPGEVFCVLDAALDPRFAENPNVDGGLGIRFYAGVPLVADGGVAVGAVCVFDPHPRAALSEIEVRRLVATADVAMAAIVAHGAAARAMAS